MEEDPRCCGSGTCIIDPEGRCWCGQQWDGNKMVPTKPVAAQSNETPPSTLCRSPQRPMLQIDFVSDVACPWCAVGLNALEQAIERVRQEVTVELHFQPFELNPMMGPEGEDSAQHLKRKYGMGDDQLAAARENLHRRGEEVGFSFGQRPRIWNTFNAHRLIHWAGLQGRQHAMKRALLQAYQSDDLNPGDRSVLMDCARQCGLDEEEAARVFDTDAYADKVREALAEWQQAGIRSVPSIVINRRHLIQGGQPVEVFEEALRKLSQGQPPNP